jgi:hypothetical protein
MSYLESSPCIIFFDLLSHIGQIVSGSGNSLDPGMHKDLVSVGSCLGINDQERLDELLGAV